MKRRGQSSGATPADDSSTESTGSEQEGSPPKRLRTRTNADDNQEISAFGSDDSESDSELHETPSKVTRRPLSHISVPGPAFPRSQYKGWTPPLEPSLERNALSELLELHEKYHASNNETPEYVCFNLDEFTIYRPNCLGHAYELATLDRLRNRRRFSELLFDGILSGKNERRFVQGVRFETLSIDGYGGQSFTSLRDDIWIQSKQAERQGVWYRLGKPAQEYDRFYTPFLWLAQFTRQFVDYLLDTEKVTLRHFRWQFHYWLNARYRHNEVFQKWIKLCGLCDFRTTVGAHIGFLWKESYSLDLQDLTTRDSRLCKHPVWEEVDPERLKGIQERHNEEHNTLVTPLVYDCFRRMYFGDHLKMRAVLDGNVLRELARQKSLHGLTPFGAPIPPDTNMLTPRSLQDTTPEVGFDISAGDVVCINANDKGPWKTASSTWLAYVQCVRQVAVHKVMDIIWLYEPSDTTLGSAYYPFANELFMSDNCECGKHALDIDHVTGVVDVAWFVKDPDAVSGLFVRQKFRTMHSEDTYDFVSLQHSDFKCPCTKQLPIFEECRQKYQIGDTVLVRQYNANLGEDALEPAQIVDFNLRSRKVVLRQLQRKTRHDTRAKSNELILTREVFCTVASKVIRKCYVRFFEAEIVEEGLPTPYDRSGGGDFYFIIKGAESRDLSSIPSPKQDDTIGNGSGRSGDDGAELPPLESGPDLTAPTPFKKLNGMGIFCGGGNFDRGLEDGGAVDFQYAVDWAQRAIYSYRANADRPENMHFFWGSVNDYISKALAGSRDPCVARVGQVDLIAAGSPCPGFSNLQPDKQSAESLRNASLVASVVSFVDFYSPKYCVLENVVSMTAGMGINKDENVFAQTLATVVALGYQVQQFLSDAWSVGSSQSRSRMFIVATAPGLEPLRHPPHTHAHPKDTRMTQKALGKASNGKAFGLRRDEYTPFQHTTPAQNTSDLPDSADSLCPAFPDHRTPSDESAASRARIASVPVRPHGMGLVQTALSGKLIGEPMEFYQRLGPVRKRPTSKTYSRVYPNGLFPTVLTSLRIACGVSGRTLHWNQDRPLTVMELRRAQGFLDHEVIIGSPPQQVVIIGNSVDRKVALALGLALRESWSTTVARPDAGQYHHLHNSALDGAEEEDAAQTGEGTGLLDNVQMLPTRPRLATPESDSQSDQSSSRVLEGETDGEHSVGVGGGNERQSQARTLRRAAYVLIERGA